MDTTLNHDLAMGIMNLIAAEEHLYFTAQKTQNDAYYEELHRVRDLRTHMMNELLGESPTGETWCATKHLLSASMRLYETANKFSKDGDKEKAKEMYKKAFDVYASFARTVSPESSVDGTPDPTSFEVVVNNLTNCCDE